MRGMRHSRRVFPLFAILPNLEVDSLGESVKLSDNEPEGGTIPYRRRLKGFFPDSSMVEHPAVNRVVVGSSPTRGVYFALFILSTIPQ